MEEKEKKKEQKYRKRRTLDSTERDKNTEFTMELSRVNKTKYSNVL